ncbi:MAG: hypothetical protein KKE55_06765, partial [Candidatus Omnitrophica bacterium]|nr:hypothetical protein [Candidatus Omnitrophota bacterium]
GRLKIKSIYLFVLFLVVFVFSSFAYDLEEELNSNLEHLEKATEEKNLRIESLEKEVSRLKGEKEELSLFLKEKYEIINNLNSQLNTLSQNQTQFNGKAEIEKDRQQLIEEFSNKEEELKQQVQTLTFQLNASSQNQAQLNDKIAEIEEDKQQLTQQFSAKEESLREEIQTRAKAYQEKEKEFTRQIEKKGEIIQGLEAKLKTKPLLKYKKQVKELTGRLKESELCANKDIQALKGQLRGEEKERQRIEAEFSKEKESLARQIEKKDKVIQGLEAKLKTKPLLKYKEKVKELSGQLKESITQANKDIQALKDQLRGEEKERQTIGAEFSKEKENLTRQIEKKDKAIGSLEAKIRSYTKKKLLQQLRAKDAQLVKLQEKLKEKEAGGLEEKEKLLKGLEFKDNEVKELKRTIKNALDRIEGLP